MGLDVVEVGRGTVVRREQVVSPCRAVIEQVARVVGRLGPLVKAGAVDSHRYDHYSLERTLAAGFGVAPLARARTARVIGDIWRGT